MIEFDPSFYYKTCYDVLALSAIQHLGGALSPLLANDLYLYTFDYHSPDPFGLGGHFDIWRDHVEVLREMGIEFGQTDPCSSVLDALATFLSDHSLLIVPVDTYACPRKGSPIRGPAHQLHFVLPLNSGFGNDVIEILDTPQWFPSNAAVFLSKMTADELEHAYQSCREYYPGECSRPSWYQRRDFRDPAVLQEAPNAYKRAAICSMRRIRASIDSIQRQIEAIESASDPVLRETKHDTVLRRLFRVSRMKEAERRRLTEFLPHCTNLIFQVDLTIELIERYKVFAGMFLICRRPRAGVIALLRQWAHAEHHFLDQLGSILTADRQTSPYG